MSTDLFWLWLRWDQGHGEFKPYGQHYLPVRPKELPARIPADWKIRKAVWVARRRKLESHLPDPLFSKNGVYTTTLGGFHEAKQREAVAAGYGGWVAILSDPVADPNAERELEELERKRRELTVAGFKIGGWSAAYLEPEKSVARAVATIERKGYAFWIANGELWWENEGSVLADRWIAEWNRLMKGFPLAISLLSKGDNWPSARAFNYKPWVEAKASIQPQVYGNTHPGFSVQNGLDAMQRGGVPTSLLNLTFGTYPTGNPIPVADYRSWRGPRSLYLGETTTSDVYRALTL